MPKKPPPTKIDPNRPWEKVEGPVFPLDDLDALDHAVIREKMANPTITIKRLAGTFGCGLTSLKARMKRPRFKAALQAMLNDSSKSALAILKENENKASMVLVDLMNSKDERVRRGAAGDLLEYSIGKKVRGKVSGKVQLPLNFLSEDQKRKVAEKILGERRRKRK